MLKKSVITNTLFFFLLINCAGVKPNANLHMREMALQNTHASLISETVFSPDNKSIISASYDGSIKVWSTEKGSLTNTLTGHKLGVTSIAVSLNGENLVSGSLDKTVKLWDIEKAKALLTLSGATMGISSVLFTPDDKYILASSFDGTIWQWNKSDGTLVYSLNDKPFGVKNIEISPNGKYLASSGWHNVIKLWDLESHSFKTLEGHTSPVNSLQFTADSQHLYSTSSDKTIRFWDLTSSKSTPIISDKQFLENLCVSPDGQYILASNQNHDILLMKNDGKIVSVMKAQAKDSLTRIQFSADGKYITFGKDNQILLLSINNLLENKTWDAKIIINQNDTKNIKLDDTRKIPVKILRTSGDTPDWLEKDSLIGVYDGKKVIVLVVASGDGDGSNTDITIASVENALVFRQIYNAWKLIHIKDNNYFLETILKYLGCISPKSVVIRPHTNIQKWWKEYINPIYNNHYWVGYSDTSYFEYYNLVYSSYDNFKSYRDTILTKFEKDSSLSKIEKKLLDTLKAKLKKMDREPLDYKLDKVNQK